MDAPPETRLVKVSHPRVTFLRIQISRTGFGIARRRVRIARIGAFFLSHGRRRPSTDSFVALTRANSQRIVGWFWETVNARAEDIVVFQLCTY
jgi:hypothetical protein